MTALELINNARRELRDTTPLAGTWRDADFYPAVTQARRALVGLHPAALCTTAMTVTIPPDVSAGSDSLGVDDAWAAAMLYHVCAAMCRMLRDDEAAEKRAVQFDGMWVREVAA